MKIWTNDRSNIRWKALDEIYKIHIYASLGYTFMRLLEKRTEVENEMMKIYNTEKGGIK